MQPHPPEEGQTEQQYELSAAVPAEKSPALSDDLPNAEINVSIVEPVHPEKDSPDLQGVSAAAGDGQNRRKTDASFRPAEDAPAPARLSRTTSEQSGNASDDCGADTLNEDEEWAAQFMSRMLPAAPDIIQAVRAHHAVRLFGRVFRIGASASCAKASFETETIDQFWSHSWHGPSWNKAMTAVYLNNGMVAALVAALVAVLLMSLHAYQILPCLHFGRPPYPENSFWVSAVCLVLYFVVLLFWKPSQSIFLDAFCIDQVSRRRFGLGLVSIGAFLRASDSLVVFWDPSWSRRLWCVFELAAFLHSRNADERKVKLTIRPTLLGPFFISLPIALSYVMLALTFFPNKDHLEGTDPGFLRYFVLWPSIALFILTGFSWSAIKLRAYFRYVQALEQDIGQFVADSSSSYCCTVGHVSEDGKPLTCDRRVILQCITLWFGSIENFEAHVRTDVLQCLQEQLSTEVFTNKQIAVSALPMLWHYMDAAATAHFDQLSRGEEPSGAALQELVRGLGWAFGVVPATMLIGIRLSYVLQSRRTWMVCELMVNLCIMAVVFLFVFGALVFEQLAWQFYPVDQNMNVWARRLPGTAIFSATMLVIAGGLATIRHGQYFARFPYSISNSCH
ncbi:unnamed protein product [Symbiodinium microadriaticum]|nr:unnamed protein product [Symbiodinium microadriaticum]